MSIDRNFRIACLGLALSLLLGGCSGNKPDDSATAKPTPKATAATTPAAGTATPGASGSPSADLTPDAGISPLGGKPASEAEIEYYGKKKQAEDLALAQNYAEAIPLFEALHAENPEDVDVMFYLLLSHGANEPAPTKKSKAYAYAEKLVKTAPDSREAGKARSYINSANLNIPDKFKYGTDTMLAMGGWVLSEEATYKTSVDMPFHTEIKARGLSPQDQATLWETEAAPATSPATEKLPKGTEVKVLGVKDFIYGLTSWRKKVVEDPDKYDTTIFDVSAMYVEVTGEGPLKGQKGWIVNQVDRFLANGAEDPWGAWISNRLKVLREQDLNTESPK